MSKETVYLSRFAYFAAMNWSDVCSPIVSGASRGIGLGLVSSLAKRSNVKIYAGARNPGSAAQLNPIVEKSDGKVVIVKLDTTNIEDARAAGLKIEGSEGKLDVVVANAGGSA
jgi:NAD(P)-dependent dehydrogenase (short-subunit alcohol dehydrogenase family)